MEACASSVRRSGELSRPSVRRHGVVLLRCCGEKYPDYAAVCMDRQPPPIHPTKNNLRKAISSMEEKRQQENAAEGTHSS